MLSSASAHRFLVRFLVLCGLALSLFFSVQTASRLDLEAVVLSSSSSSLSSLAVLSSLPALTTTGDCNHTIEILQANPQTHKKNNNKDRYIPTYSWQQPLGVDEDDFDGVPARVWPVFNDGKGGVPCETVAESDWDQLKARATRPTATGMLLQKTWKTGSSTAVGVHLRLATLEAQRRNLPRLCQVRFAHATASQMYGGRNRRDGKSFLWTTVRDPTLRAVSQFFHFDASRYKKEPSDANFQGMLQDEWIYSHYATYSSVSGTAVLPQVSQRAAHVLSDEYDFIAVTERFDESMVVLSMLLRVPVTNVLYLQSKSHGGYDDGMGRVKNKRICTYIVPSFVSPGMRHYFASADWQDRVHWDDMIYRAANRSLDLTIDALGRDKFRTRLAEYQRLLQTVRETCANRAIFPCTSGGQAIPFHKTNCLWHDSGCGNDCIDQVVANYSHSSVN